MTQKVTMTILGIVSYQYYHTFDLLINENLYLGVRRGPYGFYFAALDPEAGTHRLIALVVARAA